MRVRVETECTAAPPADLSWWLAAQLWEIELDGDVVEARHKVVARRGRLIRRLDEYAARGFAPSAS